MRKLLIAAVTAAALGTMGLTIPAQAANHQAQPGHSRIAQPVAQKASGAAGIPISVLVTDLPTDEACTITGTPTGVPTPDSTTNPGAGTVGAAQVDSNCQVEVWVVFDKAGTHKIVIKISISGETITITITFSILTAPCEDDAVGVGSDTITPLTDALATDFNDTLTPRTKCPTKDTENGWEYSWDAVNPVTGAIGDQITPKQGCNPIARPDGSSAGITALGGSQVIADGDNCLNFARSSRPRASTDPPYAAGGVAFTALAGDAVTWSFPAANKSAPQDLTTAQLNAIYTCTDTNWDQVGGKDHAIAPFLPQSGSGTLSFFLAAIGVTTPGPCVSNNDNTLEENEGVNPILNNAGGIFIYSVGDWIAQSEHSAKCINKACTPNSKGQTCIRLPGLLQFWCNVHGTMKLGWINGVRPLSGTAPNQTINTAFPSTFDRVLYNVVPFDPSTADHIPGDEPEAPGGTDLEEIFGATGFDCSNAAAKADITAYGFLNLPSCGSTN